MKLNILMMMILILIASGCNNQSKEQQSNIDKQQNNINKQMDTSLFFIDNKSVVYGFGFVSCQDCFPIVWNGLTGVIVELTDEQYEIVRKLDKQTWLNLLNSPNSDFAANLILYRIYEKDGTRLSVLAEEDNFCELWKKYKKDKELDYWEEHLDSVLCGVKCQNHDW